LKLLTILILTIFLFSGCDKTTEPTDPDDQQEEEHDQGEAEKKQYPFEEPWC